VRTTSRFGVRPSRAQDPGFGLPCCPRGDIPRVAQRFYVGSSVNHSSLSPEGTTETLTNVASHSIYGCWASGTLLVAGPVDVEPSGMKRSSGVLVSMWGVDGGAWTILSSEVAPGTIWMEA